MGSTQWDETRGPSSTASSFNASLLPGLVWMRTVVPCYRLASTNDAAHTRILLQQSVLLHFKEEDPVVPKAPTFIPHRAACLMPIGRCYMISSLRPGMGSD